MIDTEIQLTKNREAVIQYVITYPEILLEKATLQDLLTVTDKLYIDKETLTVPVDSILYPNRLIDVGENVLYRLVTFTQEHEASTEYKVTLEKTNIENITTERLICPRTKFTLKSGDIINFKEDKPIDTTFGRFLVNYVLFVCCFDDTVPYTNKMLDVKNINNTIKPYILDNKVTPEQYLKFLENVTYLEIPEYVAPNTTITSFKTPTNMIELKKKLSKEYGERIKNGDQIAMIEYEQALLKLDNENLKDDLSNRYFLSSDQKNVKRKKMFLTVGILEKYGEPGKFSFMENSFADGWEQSNIGDLANEARQGSASRAIGTQISGEEAAFILRVFQNLNITEDDCKTKRYLPRLLTNDNYTDYTDRHIIQGDNVILLDKTTIQKYIGKTIKLRSPLYCETPNGLCYTCMKKIFKELHQESLATIIQNFASFFLNFELKKSHGKSHNFVKLTSIGKYCI